MASSPCPKATADVPLHRGVGEVALEPGVDEGRGEDVEEGVAHLEVGLGVLEPDRVDLVRHRARPDGALPADLGEVAEGDVAPHVGAEVVEHPVEPGQVGIQLGLPVVALDLGRQRVPGQAEALDEGLADRLPVRLGDGDDVRAVGAGRAVELAEELGPPDPGRAGAGAGGRGRRAPCRASSASPAGRGCGRAWGSSRRSDGHRRDLLDELGGARQPHVLDGAADHEGVGEVVDVLARAGEVDELGEPGVLGGRGDRGQPLLDEVLDGLDVVLGDLLGLGQLGDLGGAEVLDDGAQARPSRRR